MIGAMRARIQFDPSDSTFYVQVPRTRYTRIKGRPYTAWETCCHEIEVYSYPSVSSPTTFETRMAAEEWVKRKGLELDTAEATLQ